MNELSEPTKDVLDVAAASTALASLAAWLPPTASLLTIIWLSIRIYVQIQEFKKQSNRED
jgi:hypothetical protein|tara:strand:+ start:626 stop:805 length:180 start_codon:yes stop_codon:yes gene_type:complete